MNKILNDIPADEAYYFFGSHGFFIVSKEIFSNEQVGYRSDPDGNDLTGMQDGDWIKDWYVIGRDTTVGEPFFVDTSKVGKPVYTARHGEGSWSPDIVSETLEGFMNSLQYLQDVSGQTDALLAPVSTTVVKEERLMDTKRKLVALCGDVSEEFWTAFIEQYQDWIIESEDYDDED